MGPIFWSLFGFGRVWVSGLLIVAFIGYHYHNHCYYHCHYYYWCSFYHYYYHYHHYHYYYHYHYHYTTLLPLPLLWLFFHPEHRGYLQQRAKCGLVRLAGAGLSALQALGGQWAPVCVRAATLHVTGAGAC